MSEEKKDTFTPNDVKVRLEFRGRHAPDIMREMLVAYPDMDKADADDLAINACHSLIAKMVVAYEEDIKNMEEPEVIPDIEVDTDSEPDVEPDVEGEESK